MFYDIDMVSLFTIVFFSIVIFMVAYLTTRKPIHKIYLIFSSVSIFVYSGIGNSYKEIGSDYSIKFLVFFGITILTMSLIFNSRVVLKRNKDSIKKSSSKISKGVILTLVILFFCVYLVRLTYPVMRLSYLYNPPPLSINDIFIRYEQLRSLPIWEIFRLINVATFVFFMIYIQKLKKKNKIIIVLILICSWIYLEYITLGYISRYEMVVYFVFLFIIVINRNMNDYRLKFKTMMILGVIFVALMPFMLSFEMLRQGGQVTSSGSFDAILRLFFKESDYPKYYNEAVLINTPGLWKRFYHWFFTLPIPSIISGTFKSDVLIVNRYFTEAYSGILYGDYGFSIILPSILGESLMIYGKNYYWVHGLFTGVFVGLLGNVLSKNDDLSTLNLFYAVKMISLGRGGVTGIIGLVVNSLVFYALIMFLIKLMTTKKNLHDDKEKNNEDISDINTQSI